jgi:DNA-binding transcriptional LysR family regulator
MDTTIRKAMVDAGVDYRPAFECSSLLQVRRLLENGVCAAVMPSIGSRNLPGVRMLPFAPLKDYGRSLVLHWNDRHRERRGVTIAAIHNMSESLKRWNES